MFMKYLLLVWTEANFDHDINKLSKSACIYRILGLLFTINRYLLYNIL